MNFDNLFTDEWNLEINFDIDGKLIVSVNHI